MKFQLAIAVTLAALASAACSESNSKAAAKMTPLTAEQKTKIADLTTSMSAASEAAQKAGGAANGGLILAEPSLPGQQKPAPTPIEKPISKEEKLAKMSEKLQNNCTFDITKPEENAKNFNFHFIAGGDACPIEMKNGFTMNTSESSNAIDLNMSMDMMYRVKDQEYAAMNDNQGMELKGNFSLHGDRNGVAGNGLFKGYVASQTYGQVGLAMGMSVSAGQNGATTTMSLMFKFPDFRAVGRVVSTTAAGRDGFANTNVQYFVNDVAVDQKEFMDTFGSTTGTPGTPQNPGTLLNKLTQLQ